MRRTIVVLAALALAAAAYAVEKSDIIKTEIAGPGDGQPFEIVINDDAGNPLATLTCSKLDEGKKDIKVYFLDPQHMPDPEANVNVTWGSEIKEVLVKSNVVAIIQLRNFHPDGQSTLTLKLNTAGSVANRLKYGNIKAENMVAVANTPGQWGSVVSTSGLKGDGLKPPKYLDLTTEYGVKVNVDTAKWKSADFTWTYEPMKGLAVLDGQLDIGIMVVTK